MARVHDWESSLHDFETAEYRAAFCDSDESSDDDMELSPGQASQELADFLISLQMRGRLSARDVCTICFLAKSANLCGAAAEFAYKPSAPSGHFQRHLDRILKVDEALGDDIYEMTVPGSDKLILGRTPLSLPAIPPHETLAQEVAELSNGAELLEQKRAAIEWGQAYEQRPVVRAAESSEL
eukprot:9331341-Alexandrium_andersonii.AAC.1